MADRKSGISPPPPFKIEEEPANKELFFRKSLNERRNYYQEALKNLDQEGGMIRFIGKRPSQRLAAAAKKLGYVLAFCEDGNDLLVKITGTTDE